MSTTPASLSSPRPRAPSSEPALVGGRASPRSAAGPMIWISRRGCGIPGRDPEPRRSAAAAPRRRPSSLGDGLQLDEKIAEFGSAIDRRSCPVRREEPESSGLFGLPPSLAGAGGLVRQARRRRGEVIDDGVASSMGREESLLELWKRRIARTTMGAEGEVAEGRLGRPSCALIAPDDVL